MREKIKWGLCLVYLLGSLTITAQHEDLMTAKKYYFEGNYGKADAIFQNFINQGSISDSDYLEYVSLLINWQEYSKADHLLQAYGNSHLNVDSSDIDFTNYLLQLSHLKIEQKQYDTAEELIAKQINLNSLENTLYKVKALTLLGELYLETDRFEESKKYLDLAIESYANDSYSIEGLLAIIYNHKGRLLLELDEYKEAEQIIQKAVDIEIKKGKNHPDYLQIKYNKGILFLELGRYEEAEEIFIDINKVYKSLFHNKPKYIELIGQQGILAEETGYYQVAIEKYKQVCHFFKSRNVISYTRYANRQAIILEEKLKKDSLAEEIYIDAIKLWKDKKGENNIDYASLINSLAESYEKNNQLIRADSLYQKARNILLELVGRYDYGYASVIFNLAHLQKKLGNLNAAEQYFLEVAEIDSVTIGVHHPDYIDYTVLTLANFYDLKNDLPKATAYYQKANQGKLDLINYYYATFDEQTRLNFLNGATENFNEYFSFLHRRRQKKISFAEAQLINLQIKGLALDYFQSNRTNALSTKDTLLKQYYIDYQKEKQALSQAYALSTQEHEDSDINLAELKEKVIRLEKLITRRSKDLQQDERKLEQPTFKKLQAKLKARETTIDFLSFQYSNLKEKTDTTYYYALLTEKNNPTPKFIPLCTEKQLKKILTLSNQYGAGYTKYPEIGKELYKLIWQPLEPYLKDIKTIHLSPTGLLHKVAFGGLPHDEGHLLDQYQINYYGNLRDFINATPAEIPKSIALAGGAYFDIDSTDLVKLAQETEEFAFAKLDSIALSTPIASVSRAIASDSTRNAIEFNYLPGTKKEVEQLETAFKQEGWQAVTYTGAQASEDNIKILNGENAPGILHLATHGYFFDPYEKQEGTILSDETMRERIIGAESPLLRSGLVFSGVNHSWKGGKSIAGLEDGVLTAFEIANMELWNTELVVLSACETGLGDVESTEGVFGLQRAFKAAGVNKLVISLWKIPDAQTAELMQLFYKNFLMDMPLGDALRAAQLTMSQQYGPFYWAGFVLVE